MDQGLAEAIHLCLFPNGVIGAEFFFYGPRIQQFESYLQEQLKFPFAIKQLGRHDVIDEALGYGDIRVLRMKIDPSVMSKTAAQGTSLKGLTEVASSFEAGVYAELVLRSENGDSGFNGKVKKLLGRVKKGETKPELFEKLEIEGKPDDETNVTGLDLLSQNLYRTVEIPFRTNRSRDLQSDAAFAKIREAYDEVKDDLRRDGLV